MAQAAAQMNSVKARQNAPDTSSIQVPIVFKSGHPKSQSTSLANIPQVTADLVTIKKLDSLLDLLRSHGPLSRRLRDNYGINVDHYQEIYFTFTENLERHAYSYNEEYWGKYFVAGYVQAIEDGDIQPTQRCNCGSCVRRKHGIEIHIYMFLDEDTSIEARIKSKAVKVKNLEKEIMHLQTLLRSVQNGQDINIAVDEMEAGANLRSIHYRLGDGNSTQSSDDQDGIGDTGPGPEDGIIEFSSSPPGLPPALPPRLPLRSETPEDVEMGEEDEDEDEDDAFLLGVDEQMIECDDMKDEDYVEEGTGSEYEDDDEY